MPAMTDVLMLAILVAFFALAVLFVKACERIIGPDIEAASTADDTAERRRPNGPPHDRRRERHRARARACSPSAYLVYALVFPEKL